MLRATVYIVACSAKNRTRVRLRRLREPRYLIGAIAGASYVGLTFFARARRAGAASAQRGRSPVSVTPATLLAARSGILELAGAVLLVGAALAWLIPTESGLLDFSPAEIDLLFPSPVSRRQLMIHRLMRSQLPLVFGAVASAILVPFDLATRVRVGAGMFVMLLAARVYFAGVTLARARLNTPASRARWAAWTPLALILIAAGVVGASALAAAVSSGSQSLRTSLAAAARAMGSGASAVILAPFVALLRPLFAESSAEVAVSLSLAVGVVGALVIWLLRSDETFQEVAERLETTRTARGLSARVPRSKSVAWPLSLTGRTETVFFWKNAMQTLRGTNLARVLPFLIPVVVLTVAGTTAGLSQAGARGPAAALATGALGVAGFFVLLGPQVMRSDLRGDLPHLDLLKTWPLEPAAVIRGELVWPSVLLTLCSWMALACAAVFSAAAFPMVPAVYRLSLAVAGMLLIPAFITAQFTIQTAAVVLFPAWVPTGAQRPRGLDALGQRLILLGGVILGVVVLVGPGAIAGGIVTLVLFPLIGAVAVIPASLVCLAVSAIVISIVTEVLGAAFDRMDLAQIEKAE